MSAEFDPNAPDPLDPAGPQATGAGEQPITKFARFFKTYSLGLSLVVAAIPLGIARWSLIPMFESSKYSLTIITSVASYLLVGYIFSQRQAIARLYFPGVRLGMRRGKVLVAPSDELRVSRLFSRFAPSFLALLAVALFIGYLVVVSQATHRAAYEYATELPEGSQQATLTRARLEPGLSEKITPARLPFGQGKPVLIIREERKVKDEVTTSESIQFPDEESVRALLAGVPSASIPRGTLMSLLFLGAFLCAASAFVLMGLKDYLQEVLDLSDKDLILNPAVGTTVRPFMVEGVPGVYGNMEYSPYNLEYPPTFDGCYCVTHERKLLAAARSDKSPDVVVKWQHVWRTDKGVMQEDCDVVAEMSPMELDHRMRETGRKEFQTEVSLASTSSRPHKSHAPKSRKGAPQTPAGPPAQIQAPSVITTPN